MPVERQEIKKMSKQINFLLLHFSEQKLSSHNRLLRKINVVYILFFTLSSTEKKLQYNTIQFTIIFFYDEDEVNVALPSCVFGGSWGVCTTCRTFCTDRVCPTCGRACVSCGRCCLQTACRSLQTHIWKASHLKQDNTQFRVFKCVFKIVIIIYWFFFSTFHFCGGRGGLSRQ